ncbi:MAG TPA: SRPBCC domain-containing protein [Burkholderiaceae bacterium]|nr:SRPBCC domain-containing protein [Burkholderiaceae bacterium]
MRKTSFGRWSAGVLVLTSLAASADVGNVTSTGFVAIFRDEVTASPNDVWQAVTQLPRWWSNEHTYSGQAARMTFDPQAGGCWCERWGANSVEHGRVLHALPPRSLRVKGNLGPLQELPVNGVMTFTIAMQETKTIVRLTYRVAGPPDAGLEKLAPLVDQVLGQQFKRLVRFAETGKPE